MRLVAILFWVCCLCFMIVGLRLFILCGFIDCVLLVLRCCLFGCCLGVVVLFGVLIC